MRRWAMWMSLATAAVVGLSCGPAPLYSENGPSGTAIITPRASWVVKGTLANAAAAVDGQFETAAVAPPGLAPVKLYVDLGKTCLFNMVVLEHGRDETACGRQVQVAVSMDGATYGPVATTTGGRRVTVISLIGPVLARYLELTAVPGSQGWAVAEMYVE